MAGGLGMGSTWLKTLGKVLWVSAMSASGV